MKKLSKVTSIILSLVLAIQISLGVTCMNVEAQANIALHEDITDSTLATLSNTIISNTSWATLSNCSTFAEKCWNSFSSRKLSAGWIDTPAAQCCSGTFSVLESFGSSSSVSLKENIVAMR